MDVLPRGERPSRFGKDMKNFFDFNPRSRVGSDVCFTEFYHTANYFNPRSRVGSDSGPIANLPTHAISIHAPAWGATAVWRIGKLRIKFQSTLPRGERLTCLKRTNANAGISILAPAWGATLTQRPLQASNKFQSTLPRGERRGVLNDGMVDVYFNPRSRVGSDAVSPAELGGGGADFNPRSRVGSDCECRASSRNLHDFNPRSRVGSDRASSWLPDTTIPFQSTLPRGERQLGVIAQQLQAIISIHAPAWGATAP